MGQKRVKQYKKIIKKELIKAKNDILFEEIKKIKNLPFWERVKIGFWIMKGK